jgi:hypothetical protein
MVVEANKLVTDKETKLNTTVSTVKQLRDELVESQTACKLALETIPASFSDYCNKNPGVSDLPFEQRIDAYTNELAKIENQFFSEGKNQERQVRVTAITQQTAELDLLTQQTNQTKTTFTNPNQENGLMQRKEQLVEELDNRSRDIEKTTIKRLSWFRRGVIALGAGGGAIFGGVFGAIAGFFVAGPFGAAAGGAVGAIGGAAAGGAIVNAIIPAAKPAVPSVVAAAAQPLLSDVGGAAEDVAGSGNLHIQELGIVEFPQPIAIAGPSSVRQPSPLPSPTVVSGSLFSRSSTSKKPEQQPAKPGVGPAIESGQGSWKGLGEALNKQPSSPPPTDSSSNTPRKS